MYWLRWHYHVKDIAGAPYKIKKKSKQKQEAQLSQRQRDASCHWRVLVPISISGLYVVPILRYSATKKTACPLNWG